VRGRDSACIHGIRPTDRIESRTTNEYGRTAEERDLILSHLAEVEPLLRAACTHEIDATQPIHRVVRQLIAIGGDAAEVGGEAIRDHREMWVMLYRVSLDADALGPTVVSRVFLDV